MARQDIMKLARQLGLSDERIKKIIDTSETSGSKRSIDRRIKYNFVKEVTGDTKLAQRARDWRMEYIRQVKVKDNIPVLTRIQDIRKYRKKLPPSEEAIKAYMDYEKLTRPSKLKHKYHRARAKGYKSAEASKMSHWSDEKFDKAVDDWYQPPYKSEKDLLRRKNLWTRDSIHENLDDKWVEKAKEINRSITTVDGAKLKDSNSYGYAVLWLWYTRGGCTLEEAKKAVKINVFNVERYTLPDIFETEGGNNEILD